MYPAYRLQLHRVHPVCVHVGHASEKNLCNFYIEQIAGETMVALHFVTGRYILHSNIIVSFLFSLATSQDDVIDQSYLYHEWISKK